MHAVGDSLALQVIIFFARSPEEELTLDDALQKFAAERTNAAHTFKRAVASGFIARSDSSGTAAYSAGPRLLAMIGGKPFAATHLRPLVETRIPSGLLEMFGYTVRPELASDRGRYRLLAEASSRSFSSSGRTPSPADGVSRKEADHV